MSSNVNTLQDEDGDSPDWIELLNVGNSNISLLDYGLSDEESDRFKSVLPDVELEPGEFYLLYASGKDRNLEASNIYWETVIRRGDATKYITPNAPVSNDWINPGFNDNAWQNGTFGIGYGDGDDQTSVPSGTISVFTRSTFTIDDLSEVSKLLLHIDYDDGYVAYLNGTEVSRASITGAAPLPYNHNADTYTEPKLIFGNSIDPINLDDYLSLLEEGENTLAIQLFNNDEFSSDLTLIPFLTLGLTARPEGGRGVSNELGMEGEIHLLPHVEFKVSSEGETLYLTSPSQVYTDSLQVPVLLADESFGRVSGDPETTNIFSASTPNAANDTQGFTGRSGDAILNASSGFYPITINVQLTNPNLGQYVHYTTDGSMPNENSPVIGRSSISISQTKTLKFKTYEPNKLPSEIKVETYFIDQRPDLPVVSVSTSPDNLWSDDHGIYVRGTNGVAGNCENGPVNWNQDWEIPIHIELYETNGAKAFSHGAGAKIFGGCSRQNPAKSLSIFFRGEYGASKLEYKLFESKDIDTFQGFVLRNSGNDFTSQGHSMMRDGLMSSLVADTEIDLQAYRPVVLYLNGEYWGIHNIREKINEHFIEANSSSKADNIDLLENDGWVVHGTNEAYSEFLSYIENNILAIQSAYLGVEDRIDIENYIDYMATQIYYANTDWPGNNMKFWRDRNDGGKFRWIMYDTDFGFNMSYGGHTNHNTLEFALDPNGPGWPNPSWSTYVLRRLVTSTYFVHKFANRMADLLNVNFKPEHVVQMIDSLSGNIQSEIPKHMQVENNGQSWGGTVEGWRSDLEQMKAFARGRPAVIEQILTQPKNQGGKLGLGAMAELTVNVSNTEQGWVKVNRIIPKSYPFNGQYFSGIDVPVTAKAKQGYVFTGWSGDVTSELATIQIQTGQSVTANFEQASGGDNITINEIMYNAADENDPGDWVELFNPTENTIDISGWELRDEDDDHSFIIPDNTMMTAGSYLVLVQDESEFLEVYDAEINLIGSFDFGFGGGGDQVRLFDENKVLVDEVEYDDEDPWPLEPDGSGYSLELKNVLLDNNAGSNWAGSLVILGTPGAINGSAVNNEEEDEQSPENIQLFQNYPNPFNPSTMISYQLPATQKVRLTIFDLTGRTIQTLVNEEQNPGNYQVSFNGTSLASGVYFYKLEVGTSVLTKKMMLLK